MKRNSEAGQTLVFVAFGMIIIGAILGLAIDMGYMRFLKRRIQTAADSAAIAGAAEIEYGDFQAAAWADSASNGFTNGSSGVTVTVNNPPQSGPNQGNPNYVEVLISKTQPTFFIRIVPGGATNSTVEARAVAQLGNAKGCIYTLLPSPGSITIGTAGRHGGGAILNAPNCAIIDNGDLISLGGRDSITASAIGVAGTVQGSTFTPTPQQGIVQATDPLAYLSAPAAPICNGASTQTITTDSVVNPGACTIVVGGLNCTASPNVVFNSGTYGGVTICGGSNVVFNSGVYAFTKSPGLSIGGTGSVTGIGVTFYNTNNTSISITNTGTVTLTGHSGGPYAGVLFYQDRNDFSPATLDGGSNPSFEGALYFPSATLRIDDIGLPASNTYTIVVAGSLDIRGSNNTFYSDYSSLTNGSPIRDAVLVE
jgi:Putative Flp pilus-assembly TadE/G-like